MAGTMGRFAYKVTKPRIDRDELFDPVVVITLAILKTDEDGTHPVSENLMTIEEIDSKIESMKANLDVVGRNAKRALDEAKECITKIISERKNK